MNVQKTLAVSVAAALLAGATLFNSGCAVMRDQQSVGEYIDDSAITASVKARLVEDKTVDAAAISVETLNGVVQLSGFAKSYAEKQRAGTLASQAEGVRKVQNNISLEAAKSE